MYQNQQLSFEIALSAGRQFADGSNSIKIEGARSVAQISHVGGNNSLEASVMIWGLNKSIMTTLTQFKTWNGGKEFNVIKIRANGLICYEGTIIDCFADFNQAPDVPLTINCLPCAFLMTAKTPPFSQAGSVKVEDIIRTVIAPFNMPLNNIGVTAVLSDPIFAGSPYSQIIAVTNAVGCFVEFSYNDVTIRERQKPLDDEPINISVGTGLIGYPMYNSIGLNIKTFYNGNYKLGQKINLTSSIPLADGEYMINAIFHNLSCEMPSGLWETNLMIVRSNSNEK